MQPDPENLPQEVIQQRLEQCRERLQAQGRQDAENKRTQLETKLQAFMERAMQLPADGVPISERSLSRA